MPVSQNYDAKILVGAELDSTRLYNQIAAVASKIPPLKLRTENFGSLGSFSKDANEFSRSLQASSARVLAFSATATQLYAISKGMESIVKSTIDVEKALTDINVILGLSSKQLDIFSNKIFDIANKTGQSFKSAADAALEFSRQGLSTEQTLKRTADALTLTRLSGLEAAESVRTITAALNGFNDVTLTSEKLLNKLAATDAAFAVSTADLANAFQRVGSTAQDTNVSLDSLIALVTSAQQTTARGGAVIGNALKSIFTRIYRADTLDTLRQFNVEIEDIAGNLLPADRILQNLAKSYQTATVEQKNFIVNLAAGLFQANQFRAILSDLSKETSIYEQALGVASTATNQAAVRQAELNKTLAASLNQLFNQIKQASAAVGDLTIRPVIENITGIPDFIDKLAGTFGDGAEDVGKNIGSGILKGLGNYLSGPGLLAGAALAFRLFGRFAEFAAKSFASILEVTNKEYQTRQQINTFLQQQPNLVAQINRQGLSQLEIQNAVLGSLRAQSLELARQGQIINATKSLVNAGSVKVTGAGLTLGKSKAVGHIPALQETVGAYAGGYTPGQVKQMSIPQLGNVYYNTAETVKKFPGLSQPAIMPPVNSKAGQSYKKNFTATHGFNPYANKGLIPSFALDLDSVKKIFGGKRIAINKDFQREFSHAIQRTMSSGRLSEADLNELTAFFKNPVLDPARIIAAKPGRTNDEHELNFLVPSRENTGIQMVLAANPNSLDKTRIVSIKNRTGYANEGLIPNYAYVPFISPLVGRVLSNTVNPFGYDIGDQFSRLAGNSPKEILSAIIKDKPIGRGPAGWDMNDGQDKMIRDFALRSMFGLGPRKGTKPLDFLTKTGKKTYSFKPFTKHYNQITEKIAKPQDLKLASQNLETGDFSFVPDDHGVMARYILSGNAKTGAFKYDDVFDIKLHPGEDFSFKEIFSNIKSAYNRHKESPTSGGFFKSFLTSLNKEIKGDFGKGYATQGKYGQSSFSNLARFLIDKISSPVRFSGEIKQPTSGYIDKLSRLYQKRESLTESSYSRVMNRMTAIRNIRAGQSALINGLQPGFFESSGLIPSFNALSTAIARENKAGVPFSHIRVGSSPQLKSGLNPAGLGVYNTKDEPLGLSQGINRVAAMGLDPKRAGTYSHGNVPNFATLASNQTTKLESQIQRLVNENINLQKQLKIIVKQPLSIGQNIEETLTRRQIASNVSGIESLRQQQIQSVKSSGTSRFTGNINSAFKDPFGRGPGTALLNPQTSSELQNEIDKLKVNIKIGATNQTQLNKSIDDLAKSFNLTDDTTKTIRRNLNQSLSTFEKTNKQFVKNREFFQARTNPAQESFTERSRIGRIRESITPLKDPKGRGGSDEDIQARVKAAKAEIERNKQLAKTANDLQDLKSKASGIGGFFGLGAGGKALRDLRKNNPDAAREITQSFQNKAFAASIVAPILGGIAQEGFGDKTATRRGFGQAGASLGNVAGFAATGFALGGGPVGAGIGATLGLLLEAPRVFKAFTDTLPDLQRKLEDLKDTSQATSAALGEYIDTSDKLAEVFKGNIPNLKNRDVEELERRQSTALLGVSNLKDRERIAALVQGPNANLVEARREIGLINQRNTQTVNATTLAANLKTLLPRITSETSIRNNAANKFRIPSVGGFGERIPVSQQERDIFDKARKDFIQKQLNDPARQRQIQELTGSTAQNALGLVNKEGKSLFDIISKDETLSTKLSNAQPGKLGDEFVKLATALGGFDLEAVARIAESFDDIDKVLGEEGGDKSRANFTIKALQDILKGGKDFRATTLANAKAIFDLNQSLFGIQKRFESLGASIEIIGAERLGNLTTNLKGNEIRQATSNNISLLTQNGEGLKNLFNLRESVLGIQNNATLQRQSLATRTGENIAETISGLRQQRIQDIENRGLTNNKTPKEIQDQIDGFLKGFDDTFGQFIDRLASGEQVTSEFLNALDKATQAQLLNIDKNRRVNDNSQTELQGTLRDFAQNFLKTRRQFNVGNEQTRIESQTGQNIALETFRNREREIGAQFDVRQNLTRNLGRIDTDVIARQGAIGRQQFGATSAQLITNRQQSLLAGSSGQLLGNAIQQRPDLASLGLNIDNLDRLPKLIAEFQEQTKGLERVFAEGGGPQIEKQLKASADTTRALIDLQAEYNRKKEESAAITKEELEDLKLQLAFARERIDEQRRINEGNARTGNFDAVRKNLGKTFSETLSFNSKDFWNTVSNDVADFGEEFKQTFKDGFAEAITGAKSFEDALRDIGLNIGKNILVKSSNLATDQLFASLFGSQSNLTGGAGLLAGLFKANGGPIRKYAKGGYVGMGSGLRDDVPALLSGGEFVINKRATSRLGVNNLAKLNGYASGGMAKDRFNSSSSSLDALFANEFYGFGDKKRPTSGKMNVSPLLSADALIDENNPQNALKFARQKYFQDLAEYNRNNAKVLRDFEKQQTSRRFGAYISAGINLAGGLASSGGGGLKTAEDFNKAGLEFGDRTGLGDFYNRAFGGLIPRKYNKGGSVFGGDDYKDNIPAYLMGGEFVFNKNAAQKLGVNNLNYMNKTGKFPGYAEGGFVGGYSPNSNNDVISKYLIDLIAVSSQIRDNFNNLRNVNTQTINPVQGNQTGGLNINNSITVNITEGKVSASSNTRVDDRSNRENQPGQNREQQGKEIGTVITKIVNDALLKESRNGGILDGIFKKK